MSFLSRVLEPPSYGYTDGQGKLSTPNLKQLFKEFFWRVNPFISTKNWLQFFGWSATILLTIPFFTFMFKYFSWKLALLGLTYGMVGLGTHGTIWFHRYSTHRSFKFRNNIWRFLFRNIVIKILPEEVYVVSHHVHHRFSERPGDPYNIFGGWLYCFFADAIHQGISRNLSEGEYKRVCGMLDQTGVHANTFEQYKKYGSVCNPVFTVTHYFLNWSFWFATFYLIGGVPLATAIFGMSAIWAFGVRTFNYDGHGRGKDKRKGGVDFNSEDFSINQIWPGYVASEWHSNHHLYPGSARCGFLNYQLDLAWFAIVGLSWVGGVTSYRDCKPEFLKKYYLPFKEEQIKNSQI